MRIIALGTGTSQGVPVIGCQCLTCVSEDSRDKRFRTSIYVEVDDTQLVIDIGPDFRTQFLQNNLTSVDHVLITHEHNDHIIGLDDIRAINFTQRKSIPLYAEKRVIGELIKRFDYVFKGDYPGKPRIDLIEIDTTPFFVNKTLIQPIRILHGSLPILAYKINDLVYITDGKTIEEEELEKIKNCKVLIINALRKESHFSHFTLSEALDMIKQINPEQAYITHVSHNMGPTKEWIQMLPPNVYALNDGMEISF